MKTYHIYSKGDVVLFRNKADKIYFNNKFAAICHSSSVEVLAFDILSTHFHGLVVVDDEKQLECLTYALKKSYGLFYSKKYGFKIGGRFLINYSQVIGKENIREKLIYVMANSVHHYVVDSPFKDQFSSVNYLFTQDYIPDIYRKALAAYVKRFDTVPARQQRLILGRDKVPGHYLVDPEGFILPGSFVNVAKVRTYFNGNFKYLRYLIDTTLKGTDKESIDENKQAVRCDGLDDMLVCSDIDSYAKAVGRQSFHFLSESEMEELLKALKLKGIHDEQCRRCLWLQAAKHMTA